MLYFLRKRTYFKGLITDERENLAISSIIRLYGTCLEYSTILV